MSRRFFTVEEADETIPSLVELFGEIAAHRRTIRELAGKVDVLELIWGSEVRDPSHSDHADFMAHRAGIERCTRGIETIINRGILERGMIFPWGGLEEGLVDFPSTYQGRMVLLCWKLGEQRVAWWHEVDAGFRGRKKITDAQRRTMGTDDPDTIDEGGPDPEELE